MNYLPYIEGTASKETGKYHFFSYKLIHLYFAYISWIEEIL